MERPFGFRFEHYLDQVAQKSVLLDETHGLDNPVRAFDLRGAPVFTYPRAKFDVVFEHGARVEILHKRRQKTVATSALHTPHTISLKKAAHDILIKLRTQPRIVWDGPSDSLYDIHLSNKQSRKSHGGKLEVWTNARYCGRRVVLKTTKDAAYMLRYILEAVVHTLVFRKCPRAVPTPLLVGLTVDNRLVVCMEELTMPSVTAYIRHLPTNACRSLLEMSRHFCETISQVQAAGFTHRDAHTSNVYVDPRTLRTRLIDFDWSAIRWGNTVLSIPRHLYDSTRESYGSNRSVDCCIFFRSLQTQLDKIRLDGVIQYVQRFLTPLMQRYEDECRFSLVGASDAVSQQLYRVASSTGELRGEYRHVHGLSRLSKDFDYEMGYYEWQTMRPDAILKSLIH